MLIAEFYNPIPPAIDAAIQFRIKSVQRFHFSLSSMQRYDSNSACRNCSDLILIRPAIDAAIKFILPSMQRSNSRFSLPSMQRSNYACHQCSDPISFKPAIDAAIRDTYTILSRHTLHKFISCEHVNALWIHALLRKIMRYCSHTCTADPSTAEEDHALLIQALMKNIRASIHDTYYYTEPPYALWIIINVSM